MSISGESGPGDELVERPGMETERMGEVFLELEATDEADATVNPAEAGLGVSGFRRPRIPSRRLSGSYEDTLVESSVSLYYY